jgi:redox-sensitive bicupin YhaK (pirin superfamily)
MALADIRSKETKMLQLRTWNSLGGRDRDWLKARYHFAIDSQGNPAHARLGSLVVWNDDEIAPHGGFPMHAHRDMEIVTYVREGVLHHEDNSGGRGEIRAGSVQALSAGRGIRHSEYNDSDAPLRLFQIWLLPRRHGIDPRWATKPFAEAQRAGRLKPLASGFPEDEDTLRIDADARVLGATVEAGQRIEYALPSTRYGYLVPARGRVLVNNRSVGERDGIAITGESGISITAVETAEIILVDAA